MMSNKWLANIDFVDAVLTVLLMNGRTISVPLAWYLQLLNASEVQRNNWQINGGYEIY